MDVSIIIPIKDEEENIDTLAREITSAVGEQPWSWECIWIDDGSEDRSLVLLEQLAKSDRRHRFLSFEKNAGQSAALWAGIQAGTGEIIATLDGDGQNDPADLPRFVDIVRSGGADMANGYRRKREDNLVRKISSRMANHFRNWTTGRTVRDVGCATRAFRRECVAQLPLFAGMHRFLPTLVATRGFTLTEAPANHRPRLKGRTKYNISNRLWVGLVDCFGIMWFKKRAFRYTIARSSESLEE